MSYSITLNVKDGKAEVTGVNEWTPDGKWVINGHWDISTESMSACRYEESGTPENPMWSAKCQVSVYNNK